MHQQNISWKILNGVLAFSLTPSFPCQNPPFFASMTTFSWQQHWRSTDNFGFDNTIDNWQAKYFHCSLQYACATVFIKQCTLIALCTVYNTVELNSYTCNCILFSWSCIISPNTLQFHMAAIQGSRFIPATSLVRFDPWVTAIDRFHWAMVTTLVSRSQTRFLNPAGR